MAVKTWVDLEAHERNQKLNQMAEEYPTLKQDNETLKKDSTQLKKDNTQLKKDNAALKKQVADYESAILSGAGKAEGNAPAVMRASVMMAKMTLPKDAGTAADAGMTTDDIILVRDLYDEWKAGKYKIGVICTKDGQVWECKTEHDSTVNIDWIPGQAPTIWVPYHGKTKESALPWLKPSGAHDAYMKGEFMIYTDDKLYKCIADNTVWTPEEYPQNWEVQEDVQ